MGIKKVMNTMRGLKNIKTSVNNLTLIRAKILELAMLTGCKIQDGGDQSMIITAPNGKSMPLLFSISIDYKRESDNLDQLYDFFVNVVKNVTGKEYENFFQAYYNVKGDVIYDLHRKDKVDRYMEKQISNARVLGYQGAIELFQAYSDRDDKHNLSKRNAVLCAIDSMRDSLDTTKIVDENNIPVIDKIAKKSSRKLNTMDSAWNYSMSMLYERLKRLEELGAQDSSEYVVRKAEYDSNVAECAPQLNIIANTEYLQKQLKDAEHHRALLSIGRARVPSRIDFWNDKESDSDQEAIERMREGITYLW